MGHHCCSISSNLLCSQVKLENLCKMAIVNPAFCSYQSSNYGREFSRISSQDVLVALPLWKGYAVIDRASLDQTHTVFVRSYACLMSTYFFVLTVPFRQLIVLLRSFHIPTELLEVIVFMYRFIFMFLEEFLVMRDTLDLKFGFGTVKQSYQTMGLLASQLFTRLMRANRQINDMLEFRFDR